MKRLTLAALLVTSSTAHAGYLHLCPPAQAPAAGPRAVLPDGSVAVAGARPAPPGCRAVPLGVDAALVEALYPLAAGERPAHTILLHAPADGAFAPSSHELPQPPQPPQPGSVPVQRPMPLRTNLLADAHVRPFGVEERVRVEHGDGRLRLVCAPGRRAAGALVEGPWRLPLATLRIRATGAASGVFALQAADGRSAAKETAYTLGKLGELGELGEPGELRKAQDMRAAVLPLPATLDRAGWRRFVILCPEHAATLSLDALALEPDDPAPAARPAPRAAWIWNAAEWREQGAGLIDWAGREGIRELFIVVPLDGARVREPGRLAAFVRRARQAGVAVTSVEGDPHMVLPAQRAATLDRVRAYAAYNRAAAPAERLRAMQFDVEPYLLPGATLAPAERERAYLAMARALHAQAGATPLEFVVPFWWGDKPALLEALAAACDGLAVMDYRTDPGDIVRFAVPFLDWAAAHGKRVHIGLEAGPVDAERQRRYVRAGAGEPARLLLAPAGGAQVLVLLREGVDAGVLPGALPRYRLAGERLLDGSATSFHGRREGLRALLPALERDFAAWPGFAGIALHGWRQEQP